MQKKPIPGYSAQSSDSQGTDSADYYIENGKYVFTSSFLLKRGYCCGSGCRHCPYEPKHRGPGYQVKNVM